MMPDVRMRGFRDLTSVPAALAVLERRVGLLDAETVPLAEAAGRVAAEDVAARVNVPHFARSAMDGYALVAASISAATADAPVEIPLRGDSMPGRPFAGTVRPGEAVRITTGAPLPEGADAVLMAELGSEIERAGVRVLAARASIAVGKHVGAIGEDVHTGTIVVKRGRRLRPQDLGVLASVGASEILAVRRPSVCVVITGDELLPPGSMPAGPFIVDANSLMLAELSRRDGAARVRIERVSDRRAEVRAAIAAATEDVVLISGGSSVGPEDHAPLVLAELGEVAVHGVAMRPASPAGFGFLGGASGALRPAFLLPGNPVSCLCAYELFAGPAIRALGGLPRAWPHAHKRCQVATRIASQVGRTDYVRVAVDGDRVTPIATSGASILSSTTRADGVVLVAEGDVGHDEGTWVEVFLY
jgi:molybdopterin molybdotransferase